MCCGVDVPHFYLEAVIASKGGTCARERSNPRNRTEPFEGAEVGRGLCHHLTFSLRILISTLCEHLLKERKYLRAAREEESYAAMDVVPAIAPPANNS